MLQWKKLAKLSACELISSAWNMLRVKMHDTQTGQHDGRECKGWSAHGSYLVWAIFFVLSPVRPTPLSPGQEHVDGNMIGGQGGHFLTLSLARMPFLGEQQGSGRVPGLKREKWGTFCISKLCPWSATAGLPRRVWDRHSLTALLSFQVIWKEHGGKSGLRLHAHIVKL